ncbi:hypothetical protein D2T33_12330 [Sinirhodobacter populi]|uniref:Uncharacterized protein n=1 Tax=Paenirhodobacter populi TaxID=2306993 RepID=A0A443IT77_9RHOB|nr:hypothetical protein [Sinirhodobacter populi]RWR10444.1 hypothetical protein D2T33_12330 [Sinirhodobacter populi]
MPAPPHQHAARPSPGEGPQRRRGGWISRCRLLAAQRPSGSCHPRLLSGRNIAARVAGKAALSGVEEGSQEAAEAISTRHGVNQGAGTDISETEGTFGDFILGALCGALGGAPAGAIAGIPRGERTDDAQLESAPQPEPEILGDDGSVAEAPAAPMTPDSPSPDVGAAEPSMSAAEPGPINPSVDPAAGPISAALARAPDLTPQPEPETPAPRLPDQKPGGEVRLYDDDAGIVRDAVVLGESQQGIRIRFDGNEYDLDPQTFDRARSTARQKDEEAKGAKTDAAPPAAAADASAISPQSAPRTPEDTLKLQNLRRRLRMVRRASRPRAWKRRARKPCAKLSPRRSLRLKRGPQMPHPKPPKTLWEAVTPPGGNGGDKPAGSGDVALDPENRSPDMGAPDGPVMAGTVEDQVRDDVQPQSDAELIEDTAQSSLTPDDRADRLRSRIDYIQGQARSNGWTGKLVAERDAAQAELQQIEAEPGQPAQGGAGDVGNQASPVPPAIPDGADQAEGNQPISLENKAAEALTTPEGNQATAVADAATEAVPETTEPRRRRGITARGMPAGTASNCPSRTRKAANGAAPGGMARSGPSPCPPTIDISGARQVLMEITSIFTWGQTRRAIRCSSLTRRTPTPAPLMSTRSWSASGMRPMPLRLTTLASRMALALIGAARSRRCRSRS